MSQIIIPADRTNKQPVRAYCRNPECLESSDQGQFEFTAEHEKVACPKCGANQAPMVGLSAIIHFLHRDKMGHIVGGGGLRYALACDHNRAYLATITNQEAATGEFRFVNCPGCLKNAVDKKLVPVQGFALLPNQIDDPTV